MFVSAVDYSLKFIIWNSIMIGCTQHSGLYFLESLYLKMGFVCALQIETLKNKKE